MSTDAEHVADTLPADVPHVVVSTSSGSRKRYHRPDPDDPSEPECDTQLQSGRARWEAKTHPRHIVFHRQCTACDWTTTDSGGDGQ